MAGNMYDSRAVDNIFRAKNRPNDNPLIVHICDINNIYDLSDNFSEQAQKLVEKLWPGPLTIILHKKNTVPDNITGNLDSVAIRFPSHKITQEIIKKCGFPLVAPSANSSGKPSPTCFDHVVQDLNNKIHGILDGGTCNIGLESTVISFLEKTPRLLRPGFVTQEQIENILNTNIIIDNSVYLKFNNNNKIISPGTKYKHYAPKAQVILVNSSSESYINFVKSKFNNKNILFMCFDEDINNIKKISNNIKYISYGPENNYNIQAQELFKILRNTDNIININTIYVHINNIINNNINKNFCDLKTAVYNRLLRASGFNIINL